jgi:hypothetical protein
MEPIFAQLSLEYFKDGKSLPWNKVANPEKIEVYSKTRWAEHPVRQAHNQYFNL